MRQSTQFSLPRLLSVLLMLASAVMIIAFQLKSAGWVLLGVSALSLLLTDKKYARDVLLLHLALAIISLTPITTDISYMHFAVMGIALSAAVLIPYLVSRLIFKDHRVKFPWHHGRRWYRKELAYIIFAAAVSYLVLPYYLTSTGAYLHWPAASDTSSIIRLFLGTNALGIWDELFFVGVVLGILKNYFPFMWANIFQAILWTAFLFELGFTGWGPIAVFLFALLQGEIYRRTESLLYIITIHLTLDFFLFLALINAHNPKIVDIFIT